jgi:hypothetical protein
VPPLATGVPAGRAGALLLPATPAGLPVRGVHLPRLPQVPASPQRRLPLLVLSAATVAGKHHLAKPVKWPPRGPTVSRVMLPCPSS